MLPLLFTSVVSQVKQRGQLASRHETNTRRKCVCYGRFSVICVAVYHVELTCAFRWSTFSTTFTRCSTRSSMSTMSTRCHIYCRKKKKKFSAWTIRGGNFFYSVEYLHLVNWLWYSIFYDNWEDSCFLSFRSCRSCIVAPHTPERHALPNMSLGEVIVITIYGDCRRPWFYYGRAFLLCQWCKLKSCLAGMFAFADRIRHCLKKYHRRLWLLWGE